MPPKRKRTDDPAAPAPATTRTTRSSTRNKAPTEKTASTADSASNATPAVEDIVERPAKKTRKTTAKATKATTSKGKTAKGNAVISNHAQAAVEDSGHLDDDTLAATASLTNTNTTTNGTAKSTASHATKSPPKTKTKTAKKAVDPASELYTPIRAQELFQAHADADEEDVIGPEGFEKLCTDAEIAMDGALPLILAWQLGAIEMGKITKSEWTKATGELRISSLHALSVCLHDLEDLLLLDKPTLKPSHAPSVHSSSSRKSSSSTSLHTEPYNRARYYKYAADKKKGFGELYLFCFTLAKPPQGRNIDMETACAFWSVLVVPKYPTLQEVIEFINEKGKYKGVNKDLWLMMLEFGQTVSPTLEGYEDDGAWPTLLDDFVSWKKSKLENADTASAETAAE